VHHVLRELFSVILQKGNPPAHFRVPGRIENPLQDAFSGIIGRMGLAGENNLNGAPSVVEQFLNAFASYRIRSARL
jgi:hypothetical protein